MVKHTQIIHWFLPTNCLSVFEHFEGLVLTLFNELCEIDILSFFKVMGVMTSIYLWYKYALHYANTQLVSAFSFISKLRI